MARLSSQVITMQDGDLPVVETVGPFVFVNLDHTTNGPQQCFHSIAEAERWGDEYAHQLSLIKAALASSLPDEQYDRAVYGESAA